MSEYQKLDSYLEKNLDQSLAELSKLVAQPSISAQGIGLKECAALVADMLRAREIFAAIGAVANVTDDQVDAVTALSGSGPAFVFTVIEALAEGGVAEGLTPEVALVLATQTVLGAAQLVSSSGATPAELRQMVITPGGTTAAGLAIMQARGTSAGLIAAVQAAAARGREMSGPAPAQTR